MDDVGSGRALGESRRGREEALRLVTQTGPLISFEEHRKGTLELGKLADIVLLDTDPFACEQDELKEIGVVRTFVGGRETFGPDMDDIGPVDGIPLG